MRRPRGARLVATLALAAAAGGAETAVLTTITIDGQMNDWTQVLADALQTSHDGPWGGLADADAPVKPEHDLTRFAWTYDATHFYFYAERSGKPKKKVFIGLYVDVDEDGRMETGEPMIGVKWEGTQENGRTDVDLYTYTAAAAGGDPLVDAGGQADGWDMPGTILRVAQLDDVNGGAPDGLSMEARVAWTDLGLAPGTPFNFHVSSSKKFEKDDEDPPELADNMGGPGGVIGTTRFAAAPLITLVKTVSATQAIPGDVLTYTVTYTSSGTVPAYSVVVVDPVPAPAVFVQGSASGPGTTIEYSHDGGLGYDGSDAAPVTHVRWSLLAPLAPGGSGSVTFQVRVP